MPAQSRVSPPQRPEHPAPWGRVGVPALPGRTAVPARSAAGGGSREHHPHSADPGGVRGRRALCPRMPFCQDAGDGKERRGLLRPRGAGKAQEEGGARAGFLSHPKMSWRWLPTAETGTAPARGPVRCSQALLGAPLTTAQFAAVASLPGGPHLPGEAHARAVGGRDEHRSGDAASANGS